MRMKRAPITTLLGLLLATAAASAGESTTILVQAHSSLQHRGLSRSAGHASATIGIDQSLANTWYLGANLATIDLPAGPQETRDLMTQAYLGRRFTPAESWSLTASAVRYDFPDAWDLGYTELAVDWRYRDAVSGRVTYSPDALGEPESGGSMEVTGRQPIGERWSASASLGTYLLARDVWNSYGYWRVGVSWLRAPFGIRLGVEGTIGDTQGIFGDRGDTRLVISVGYAD